MTIASIGLAGCAETPPAEAPASDAIAFVDVSVVPLDAERVLANQTVVVRGGTIVAMGPLADTEAPPGALRHRCSSTQWCSHRAPSMGDDEK